MAQKTIAEYKCTQQELYSISDTVYKNLLFYLSLFTAYKAKYVAAFVTALRATRKAAMDLPDEDARDTVAETFRIEMLALADTCTRNFQLLKGYINDAFDEAQHGTKYDAAGGRKYSPAKNGNWEQLVGMNSAMKNFIATNSVVLLADGYMPATFEADVIAASDSFETTYSEFKTARQTSVDTSAKVKANNLLNKEMMEICDEGQRLFASDAEMKKLFTFVVVKSLVSPAGSASFKLTVKRSIDNTPVVNAAVTLQLAGSVATVVNTDDTGIALFEKIDPADYSVSVVAAGLLTLNFEKEVNTGTDARKDVFMLQD